MQDLCQCVRNQYASQWEHLASLLGLEDYHIANISKDNENNPNRSVACCTAVLKMWLKKSSSPTWGKLDNAVKNLLNYKIQQINNTTGIAILLLDEYTYIYMCGVSDLFSSSCSITGIIHPSQHYA